MPGVGKLLWVEGRNKTRGKINETLKRVSVEEAASRLQLLTTEIVAARKENGKVKWGTWGLLRCCIRVAFQSRSSGLWCSRIRTFRRALLSPSSRWSEPRRTWLETSTQISHTLLCSLHCFPNENRVKNGTPKLKILCSHPDQTSALHKYCIQTKTQAHPHTPLKH
jgi:hypothetical protein